MKKIIFLFMCLCLFTTADLAQSRKVKSTKTKRTKKTVNFVCQLPSSVIGITLNKNEITKCSPSNSTCSEETMQIEIRTVAMAGDSDKFVYTVSDGKIIGEGADVIWDLSDVKPGSYTISAGISQPVFNDERWMVLGKVQTKTVTVKECPDCK